MDVLKAKLVKDICGLVKLSEKEVVYNFFNKIFAEWVIILLDCPKGKN